VSPVQACHGGPVAGRADVGQGGGQQRRISSARGKGREFPPKGGSTLAETRGLSAAGGGRAKRGVWFGACPAGDMRGTGLASVRRSRTMPLCTPIQDFRLRSGASA